jgi:hypothetical protein
MAMTPFGSRGVLNDAVSIYFLDATLSSAFVARWCAGYRVETAEGVFRVRADEPAARTSAMVQRRAASGRAQHRRDAARYGAETPGSIGASG